MPFSMYEMRVCHVFIIEESVYLVHWCWQSKKNAQEGAGDAEQRKFDGTGYDSDLVDALERDIVSRNPNIHW